MTPIIKVASTPESHHSVWGEKNMSYRIEVDGRAVGPVLKEKQAEVVAQWLESSWRELVAA